MLFYSAWWMLFAAAQFLILYRLGLTWKLAATDALFFTVVSGLACAAAGFVFRFYQPGPGGWVYRTAFAVAIACAVCAGYYYTMLWLFGDVYAYPRLLGSSMLIRFLLVLLLLSFHIVVMWFLSVAEDQAEVSRRKNEAETLSRDAELASLRQQLHPHFLFNSLNSISALAGTDAQATRRMVQQLSDFLRGTLKKSDALVTIAEEIAHLQLYLEIEKVRFGNRLSVDVNLADDCRDKMVPPLILQPIVENAIKYGLYGVTGNVGISVDVACRDNLLSVVVANPFGPEQNEPRGTGFGLKGVRRRLQLLYGRPDLLRTARRATIFETEIRIPQ